MAQSKGKPGRNHCRDALVAVAAVAGLYLVLALLGVGCPIRFVTGIPCPGCGMTRALVCLLRLDFAGAWLYHPLWPLVLAAPVVWWLWPRLPRWLQRVLLYGTAVAFVVVYLARLFSPGGVAVETTLSSGLVGRVVQFIFGRELQP